MKHAETAINNIPVRADTRMQFNWSVVSEVVYVDFGAGERAVLVNGNSLFLLSPTLAPGRVLL
jgi:hypothetical protein